jgi:hypothetical protein
VQILSDPFAERTCKADQALLAPGGRLLAVSNATVAGVLPPLQAMGPKAVRIASLPPKTRLAICVYRRSVAASSAHGSQTAAAVPCPSGYVPIVLTAGGPLVAYTIAESGQRMVMPTRPPSFLAPCLHPER